MLALLHIVPHNCPAAWVPCLPGPSQPRPVSRLGSCHARRSKPHRGQLALHSTSSGPAQVRSNPGERLSCAAALGRPTPHYAPEERNDVAARKRTVANLRVPNLSNIKFGNHAN